jgi:hypothetical protein
LQFERDHVPNKINNDKIIVDTSSVVEKENVEIDGTEIDIEIKVDDDIVDIDTNKSAIYMNSCNNGEGEVEHTIPIIELNDNTGQIENNSESSIEDTSSSNINLAESFIVKCNDDVDLDSNIDGLLDNMTGSGLSCSPATSSPQLSLNPFDTAISSPYLTSEPVEGDITSDMICTYVSTDPILSCTGGGNVIDMHTEILEPVTFDCVSEIETLPFSLPLTTIHEEKIAPVELSDVLLESGVNTNVMMYGDELDALLGRFLYLFIYAYIYLFDRCTIFV